LKSSNRRAAPRIAPAAANDGLIEIGRIVRRHALRGELRVRLYNPASTTLSAIDRVVLRGAELPDENRRVLGQRHHPHGVLLLVDGCDSAEAAEALVGRVVCVRRDQLPPAGPHEVYCAELVGCTVATEGGIVVGTVHDVFPTGSNDVCRVVGDAGEHLIPLIADVVVRLDLPARRLVIRPIAGLLEP
jgi:16S rRNA processing protein RimM